MPSLVEAAASIAVGGAVLTLGTAAIGSAARLDAEAGVLAGELFRVRQLEHLVDRAALAAGAGPTRPAPLSTLTATGAVFAADLDGNGIVDATSSETTALEVSMNGTDARLRIRLGRQTTTVLEAERSEAVVWGIGADGRAADAATATLVRLDVTPRDGAPVRSMLFVLPARILP